MFFNCNSPRISDFIDSNGKYVKQNNFVAIIASDQLCFELSYGNFKFRKRLHE